MRRQPLRSLCLTLALSIALPALAMPPLRLRPDAPPDRATPARLAAPDLLQAPDALAPGEFEWQPGWNDGNGAPVIVMVNLDEQRAYVFRNGQRIGTSTVSSGRPGHETPTGVYEIVQKQKMHHSNLYENDRTGAPAAMPWMQRLTWDGVALHAGHVRPKPASHGCVRLPPAFAQQLYTITHTGDTVVIAQNGSIESLSLAGVDAPLALVLGSASSLQQLARRFVSAGAEAAPASDASRSAFSP